MHSVFTHLPTFVQGSNWWETKINNLEPYNYIGVYFFFFFFVSCLQSTIFEDSILWTFGKNYSIELSVTWLTCIDVHSSFGNHSHDHLHIHCCCWNSCTSPHSYTPHHCDWGLYEKMLLSAKENSFRSRSRSGPITW